MFVWIWLEISSLVSIPDLWTSLRCFFDAYHVYFCSYLLEIISDFVSILLFSETSNRGLTNKLFFLTCDHTHINRKSSWGLMPVWSQESVRAVLWGGRGLQSSSPVSHSDTADSQVSVCLCMQKAGDSTFLRVSYFALSCSITCSTVQKYWPPPYYLHMNTKYNTKLSCNCFRNSSPGFLNILPKLFFRHWLSFFPFSVEMLRSLDFWKQEMIGVSQRQFYSSRPHFLFILMIVFIFSDMYFNTNKCLNRLL